MANWSQQRRRGSSALTGNVDLSKVAEVHASFDESDAIHLFTMVEVIVTALDRMMMMVDEE